MVRTGVIQHGARKATWRTRCCRSANVSSGARPLGWGWLALSRRDAPSGSGVGRSALFARQFARGTRHALDEIPGLPNMALLDRGLTDDGAQCVHPSELGVGHIDSAGGVEPLEQILVDPIQVIGG